MTIYCAAHAFSIIINITRPQYEGMCIIGKAYTHSRALEVMQDYQMVSFISETEVSNSIHKVPVDYTDTTTLGCPRGH